MTRHLLTTLVLIISMMVGSAALAEESAWSVNINTATAEVLAESLEGIGESKAQAIIAYREANGGFASIEDLANVKGNGAATIEKNRDSIVIE